MSLKLYESYCVQCKTNYDTDIFANPILFLQAYFAWHLQNIYLFIFLLILLHSHKKVNSTGAWICVCGSLPLCLQGMAQSLVRIRLLLTLGINEGSKMTGLFTTIINSELLLHSLHTRMCLVLNPLSLEKSIWWN